MDSVKRTLTIFSYEGVVKLLFGSKEIKLSATIVQDIFDSMFHILPFPEGFDFSENSVTVSIFEREEQSTIYIHDDRTIEKIVVHYDIVQRILDILKARL